MPQILEGEPVGGTGPLRCYKPPFDEFQINMQDGNLYTVNLSGANKINDVITTISIATSGDVAASVNAAGPSVKGPNTAS